MKKLWLCVLAIAVVGRMGDVSIASAQASQLPKATVMVAPAIQANEVALETPTGTLYGTLVLPPGKSPFPVVLLIAGSGQTDRDGNTVGLSGKSDCLKLIAQGLAQSGIATLRYDKRGVAQSASARTTHNTFEIQADDAARWVAWLGRSPQFSAVGLIGHSEGALVGTIAAQAGGVWAFVSLAGAGRRFDDVSTEQFERAARYGQLTPTGFTALRSALAEWRAGRTITTRPPNIPGWAWTGLFPPRAQEYLISLFRYDPAAEIAKLPNKGVQVMVMQGTTDLTGGAEDPRRLAVAAGVKPVMIEGMNHELKSAPLDPRANDKASEDPRLPLAPGLLAELIKFLSTALKVDQPDNTSEPHDVSHNLFRADPCAWWLFDCSRTGARS